jgi:hypothetical protein
MTIRVDLLPSEKKNLKKKRTLKDLLHFSVGLAAIGGYMFACSLPFLLMTVIVLCGFRYLGWF